MKAPDWNLPFRWHTGTSQLVVGGTLTQIHGNGEHHVSYFSKRLSTSEEKYSVNDREILGLITFLRRFRCSLEERTFEVLTGNHILMIFFYKDRSEPTRSTLSKLFGRGRIIEAYVCESGDTCTRSAFCRAPQTTNNPADDKRDAAINHSNLETLEPHLLRYMKDNYRKD